jgi:hypothetical protein
MMKENKNGAAFFRGVKPRKTEAGNQTLSPGRLSPNF